MTEGALQILQQYQDELKNDCAIDQLNMKDRSLEVITIKHKWAGIQLRHKIELSRLEKGRNKAVDIIAEKLVPKLELNVSKVAIRKQAEKDSSIVSIDDKIDDLKIILEYLEKVEKIVHSMTWDIKNIVDMVKLETQ